MYRLFKPTKNIEESADSKSTKTYFNQGSSSLVALEKWGTDSYFNDTRENVVKPVPKILDAIQTQIDGNKVLTCIDGK